MFSGIWGWWGPAMLATLKLVTEGDYALWDAVFRRVGLVLNLPI